LTTRGLDFLTARGLNFLSAARLRRLLTRACQRPWRLHILTLRLTDHRLRLRDLGRARTRLRLDCGGGEGRHRESAHYGCICSLHHVPSI